MPIDGDVRAGKARWAKYPSPPIGGFPVQIRGDGNPSITQLALNVEVGAPGHQIVSRMRAPKRYGCSVTAVVRSAHIPVDRSELLEQRLIVRYHTGDKGVLATAQIPWCRTGSIPTPSLRAKPNRSNSCSTAANVQGPKCVDAPNDRGMRFHILRVRSHIKCHPLPAKSSACLN